MKMPRPHQIENQISNLLNSEENFQIFNLLGNRCQTMVTTVVQLYLTEPPGHSYWLKKDTGVLCFVKDNIRKNYFFRLFNLKTNQLCWEQEMYNNMEYIEAAPFFHTFEGEDCMVAFNFADQQEAKVFKNAVDGKLTARRRREERKPRQLAQTQSLKLPEKNYLDNSAKQEYRKEKRRRNITKADIGTPTGFVHVSHVGWNPDTGFDILSEDAQLKALFHKAGVSEKQLQDKETRDFIYDFINKHRDSTIKSADVNPPIVPPRGPPRPTSATPRPAPPPPPAQTTLRSNQNPEYYHHHHQARKANKPPSPPKQIGGFTPAAAAAAAAPPAPPPPPPPSSSTNIPPPPPPMLTLGNGSSVTSSSSSSSSPSPCIMVDGNAALLQSIRDGTTLKPVDDHRRASPVEDPRNDLLDEIRKGIHLKPVDEREMKPVSSNATISGGNDLARALKQALLERSKVIHSEDDDDDTSSTSNDEEWDD